MTQSLRTFVALSIPRETAGFVKRIQDRLRSSVDNVRWVKVANVHLTLKFLGDIAPDMLQAIENQLNTVAGAVPPFCLTAKGVGVFPNRRQPRILWIGLAGDLNQLSALHRSLESGLASIGFKRESRAFRAHLTIGRMRQRSAANALGPLLTPLTEESSDPFAIDRICLYQSVLKPTGAEYRLLHSAHLTAADKNA